jgi:transcriptional regulator with XRE-family HTH domain
MPKQKQTTKGVIVEGHANFAKNLRALCDKTGAISTICRKANINRQQFNKYLSGDHAPSPRNLRLIANFFGLSLPVLFSEPEEFQTLLEGNFFNVIERLRHSKHVQAFIESTVLAPRTDDAHILGVYDRYQYSSIYSGEILRSIFCIYRNGEFTQHYYVEHFPSYDDPRKLGYVFRYHGFTFFLEGRIFAIDFEAEQKNEITFSNFAPVKRSMTRFMFGVASGIAATMFRQPFATKVALHHRHMGLIKPADLRRCTVLSPDDPSIPREVSLFLGDGRDMIHIR